MIRKLCLSWHKLMLCCISYIGLLWWSAASPSYSSVTPKMKPRTNVGPRSQRSKGVQNEGPNWVIIAGSALLSTLSVRLGYKLKQVLDSRQQNKTASSLKGPILFKAFWFVLWSYSALLDMRNGLKCRKRKISWRKEVRKRSFAVKYLLFCSRWWWLLQLQYRYVNSCHPFGALS